MASVTWTAGIARRCITPSPPTPFLAGYGHRDARATGKLHDVHVKALAIACGSDRAMLITLDICHISVPIVDAVRARLPADLRPALRMVASHTHSGPCCAWQLGRPSPAVDFGPVGDELRVYTTLLVEKCTEAALEALAGMVDVELRVGCGNVAFAMNRRNDTEVKMSAEAAAQLLEAQRAAPPAGQPVGDAVPWTVGDLKGPHDHRLDVLQLVRTDAGGGGGRDGSGGGGEDAGAVVGAKRKREDGDEGGDKEEEAAPRTVAVVFGYACHATTLDINLVSNDWVGCASLAIEKAAPGCTAFFATGCGGDQNPGARRHVSLCELWGLQVAREVARLCGDAARTRAIAPQGLRCASATIALPFARLPTEAELEAAATGESNCPTLLPDGADPVALEKLNATTNASFLHLIVDARKQWAAIIKNRLYPHTIGGGGSGGLGPVPGHDEEAFEMSCWRLGPATGSGGLTWFALAGEPTIDYALALKKSGEEEGAVFATGYCNGSPGYIPSERVLKEGGYEGGESMLWHGSPARWADGVEARVLEGCAAVRAACGGPPVCAIDGPAGAGKTTVSKMVAEKLGFVRVDTGAIYRCVALAATRAAQCDTKARPRHDHKTCFPTERAK